MHFLIYSLVVFMHFGNFNDSLLDNVRKNYHVFLSDKQLCQSTILDLEEHKNNSAVVLGYLGALQTIYANHAFNPIAKLRSFNTGKKNIEQAIKKEPNNIELRFIRLSIQKNAPSFLGYKANISDDTAFLIKNRQYVESEVLKNNIESLLNN